MNSNAEESLNLNLRCHFSIIYVLYQETKDCSIFEITSNKCGRASGNLSLR